MTARRERAKEKPPTEAGGLGVLATGPEVNV